MEVWSVEENKETERDFPLCGNRASIILRIRPVTDATATKGAVALILKVLERAVECSYGLEGAKFLAILLNRYLGGTAFNIGCLGGKFNLNSALCNREICSTYRLADYVFSRAYACQILSERFVAKLDIDCSVLHANCAVATVDGLV